MARSEEVVWVQLATRIPKTLHREIKVHCVDTGRSVMDFVTQAIEEKLAIPGRAVQKRTDRRGRAGR
jgi:predicted HicB family RNase H-like nuclease